jgi:hypothetical protein
MSYSLKDVDASHKSTNNSKKRSSVSASKNQKTDDLSKLFNISISDIQHDLFKTILVTSFVVGILVAVVVWQLR